MSPGARVPLTERMAWEFRASMACGANESIVSLRQWQSFSVPPTSDFLVFAREGVT